MCLCMYADVFVKTIQLVESDFAATARQTASTVAANVSKGAQGAATTVGQGINRFVEGDDHRGGGGGAAAAAGQHVDPEKKDFWDSFGAGDDGSSFGAGHHASVKTGSSSKGAGAAGGQKEEWGKDDW